MPRPRSPRLNDLISTVEQLFPEASVQRVVLRGQPQALRLVPGPRAPRIAVPAASAKAASDGLRRPSANDSFRTAVPRRLLELAFSTGMCRLLMPYGVTTAGGKDSIADYLGEVLGEPVLVSLTVGSARANRKPVLNVHNRAGKEIGFAKVGLSNLTNGLVSHEAATLGSLRETANGGFIPPTMLHSGQWRNHEVLVMTALNTDRRQRRRVLPIEAAVDIVRTGPLMEATIESSPWFARLEATADRLAGTSEAGFPELLAAYRRSFGSQVIPFGAAHGDFGPWNLALTSTVPMIWDWERYSTDSPVGLDVIHFAAHQSLRRIGNRDAARSALLGPARTHLRAVLSLATGIPDPEPRLIKALTVGYLLTMAARFTVDSLTPDGAPVRELAHWHQELIADQLEGALPLMAQEKRDSPWQS